MTVAKSCLEAAQVTCPALLSDERVKHYEFTLNMGALIGKEQSEKK